MKPEFHLPHLVKHKNHLSFSSFQGVMTEKKSLVQFFQILLFPGVRLCFFGNKTLCILSKSYNSSVKKIEMIQEFFLFLNQHTKSREIEAYFFLQFY